MYLKALVGCTHIIEGCGILFDWLTYEVRGHAFYIPSETVFPPVLYNFVNWVDGNEKIAVFDFILVFL